jgi:hypothetical protein
MKRNQVSELVLTAAVAALIDHGIQAAGCERRKLLQRLKDERQVRIDL